MRYILINTYPDLLFKNIYFDSMLLTPTLGLLIISDTLKKEAFPSSIRNFFITLKSLNRFCHVLKMSADAILYGPKDYMGTRYSEVLELLERCPREKGRYAEEILTLFLLSHDPVE